MTKPHLITSMLYPALLITLMITGFGQGPVALAQSNDISGVSQTGSGSRLTFGNDLGVGILPPVGRNNISRYFSSRTRNSILFGPESGDAEQSSRLWLELDNPGNTRNGLSAQIGLGYSPTPDLGIAFGSFFDLSATRSENIGIYQTGGYGIERHRSQVLLTEGGNSFNDAGLAASLSYMPLQDIWIGLHGSVSRNMTPTQPDQNILDGIDAMLGLTASYRIEF